ncbi:MAG: cation diffusion facilitator family transporter [Bacteroidota bacterium]|nr:cation diffusion facilitator family transporter [Bacteroidota bacterium]
MQNKTISASSEGWVSIIVNILLFGIKYWAGIVSGSIAMTSDAWHSLSDSISSLAVIIGSKIASKPPDKKHPFGHGRAELFSSILIGIFLFLVGFSFISKSIEAFTENSEAVFGKLSLIVIISSIVAKEALAQYAFYVARKTGYKSVKADGWHHRSDALSSIVILIGIFLNPYLPYVDAVMGIIVSLFIFHAAYSIIRETADDILGTAASQSIIDNITQVTDQYSEHNLHVHNLKVHKYGKLKEISFHIKLPDEMIVKDAGALINGLENKLNQTYNYRTTIHLDCIH